MRTTPALTLSAAVGAGLMAGLYFAFSTFVMGGLRHRTPDDAGLRAMQGINLAAPKDPLFLLVFTGTALVCVVLGISALTRLPDRTAVLQLAGSVAYLASIALTAGYNVPRNDRLAAVDPASPGAATAWHDYVGPWLVGNHLRTLSCVASLVLLVVAYRLD